MNSTIEDILPPETISPEFFSLSLSYTSLAVATLSLLLYIVYYCNFRKPEFVIKPEYDQKKKKIGKPLPPYPNGWYVALHSEELKKG